MEKTIKIGTRGSQLALYQANKVKSELETLFPNQAFEIIIIKTKGDKILDVALSKIGDKGLFTKEIETALIEGEVDLAVHSLKDLPTNLPEGLRLGGVLERAEFRDALVSNSGKKLSELNETDVVATSSLRRKAQLLKFNPNLKIVDIRGNVNTRLQRMADGYCTAMIMAAAGLQRLGFDDKITEIIDKDIIIPAVSQGAIAIEIRENDPFISSFIDKINHPETLVAVLAERVFLNTLEGGCQIPIGCYTVVIGEDFYIKGFIANLEGSQILVDERSGKLAKAQNLSRELAQQLFTRGGAAILEEIRKNA
jgi:hydroxymethylbilane synthase